MKPEVAYTDTKITITNGDDVITMNRSNNEERDKLIIADEIAMFERHNFYNSVEFNNEFNKQLEIAILATRGGGSGAVACRDTLLSLYNGRVYKANLSGWYDLDSTNRAALLFVLEHQTANNGHDIDQYLPQYQADFERMKKEVTDNERA